MLYVSILQCPLALRAEDPCSLQVNKLLVFGQKRGGILEVRQFSVLFCFVLQDRVFLV